MGFEHTKTTYNKYPEISHPVIGSRVLQWQVPIYRDKLSQTGHPFPLPILFARARIVRVILGA